MKTEKIKSNKRKIYRTIRKRILTRLFKKIQ